MSSATTEGRLVGTGFPALPSVNLLPPEIAEKRKFRQVQYGLGGAVAAALAVIVLLDILAAHSVSTATAALAEQDAKKANLTRQIATYQNVTAIRDQAAAAQAMLVTAMGQEVRYSHLLSDLSLSIPDNIWLTNLSYSQGTVTAAVGAPVGGIGTLNVSAVGFSHDDVAVWLDSLAAQPNYVSPDFGSSNEGLLGTRKTVTFSSTATVTEAALSHRYTTPAGG
ncbi:MAG: PilN domain-containing protein [Actinomycetota bacterium]|nr:PilN domain-containing protein [Actinomycetota bacterium]